MYTYVCVYIYIYIHIYMHTHNISISCVLHACLWSCHNLSGSGKRWAICSNNIRYMGCATRNLAPRNHLLVWIVKPSGCQMGT